MPPKKATSGKPKRQTKGSSSSKSKKNKKSGTKSMSIGDIFHVAALASSSREFPHDVSVMKMFSWILGIVFNIVIIVYLVQLELTNCACTDSHSWMPGFLKFAMAISILIVPFTLFLRTRLDLMIKMWQNGFLKLLGVFLLVIGVLKTYSLFNYSLHLYNCKCADDWRRTLMLWEGIFGVIVYFFFFMLLLYAGVKGLIK
tara:strand:- start:221 stop:820 length:600 start_codon:yes stop_codon:yes gene_type:complete